MEKVLKIVWDYTHDEIRELINELLSEFETKKTFDDRDDSMRHSITLGLKSGGYDRRFEFIEWGSLYGLYIVSIDDQDIRGGKPWENYQPVVKFHKKEEFLQDRIINDLYNWFQRNKNFDEYLKTL